MTEKPRLVLEKVLAFKMEEVLGIIQTTAEKKKWTITDRKEGHGVNRLTVRFCQPADEYIFEVSREEARAVTSSLHFPQTRLTVWAQGAERGKNGIAELTEAIHIAFLRAGG